MAKLAAVKEAKEQHSEPLDEVPLIALDHVEFYVGNAKQAAHFYQTAFGFQPLAYKGLETGSRDAVSYVLRQGSIRFVLTGGLHPQSEVSQHVLRHGDGVKTIAFEVDDVAKTHNITTGRGAVSALSVQELKDKDGTAKLAAIRTYGETVHALVERKNYKGAFLPGFRPWKTTWSYPEAGLQRIDHCVGNVELGKMNTWVDFYAKVLGFKNMISFSDDQISTEYTALMSKVMANSKETLKFPINEPALSKKKSQIDEYLEYYGGPGVQHIALHTGDIIKTVKDLKARGVKFLSIPHSYYSELPARIGAIKENLRDLEQLGILADRDPYGYLLQIFTQPMEDRPTLFFEVIQREGAKSFGLGNFKSLFEAIEREQAKRGNLTPTASAASAETEIGGAYLPAGGRAGKR